METIRKLLLNNWKGKVIAFLFAIITWGIIDSQVTDTIRLTKIPVEFLPDRNDVVILSVSDVSFNTSTKKQITELSAWFSGPGSLISDLKNRRIEYKQRLNIPAGAPNHSIIVEVDGSNFTNINPKIRLNNVTPSRLKIDYDYIAIVEKPVIVKEEDKEIKTNGNSSASYKIKEIYPKTVKVKGPLSILNEIDILEIEPIKINNRKASFIYNAKVDLSPWNGLVTSNDVIKVSVVLVKPSSISVTAQINLILPSECPYNVKLAESNKTLTFELEGNETIINELKNKKVSDYLSLVAEVYKILPEKESEISNDGRIMECTLQYMFDDSVRHYVERGSLSVSGKAPTQVPVIIKRK